ncbi:SCO2322 family protein [Kitasatospora sp. McL0602]|uniref:SCO2322 family protein n=1 Tax=Kitasatospora sp. McL0602 TaxID=3439530 RepID=UPI003F8860C4
MTLSPRRTAAARAAAVLAPLLALLALVPAPAAHATGYRYWSFWKGTGAGTAWAYQQQGPAGYVPPDGGTDGWRFAVSPDGGQDAARPVAPAEFATACATTPAQPGRKRVAVVLDFGTATDAPSGEAPPAARTACAAVPAGANSAEVLAAVAPPLRYDTNGMLCAIAGYPRSGCGDTVNSAQQPTTSSSSSSGIGPTLGVIAGAALVALLGGAAVWQARRR